MDIRLTNPDGYVEFPKRQIRASVIKRISLTSLSALLTLAHGGFGVRAYVHASGTQGYGEVNYEPGKPVPAQLVLPSELTFSGCFLWCVGGFELPVPNPQRTRCGNRAKRSSLSEFSQTLETDEDVSNREKIEALAEIICGAGDKAAGALFVLMGTLQNSTEPEALAHAAKHLVFTRCGELNLFGMVDAQIAVVEGELLANNMLLS